MSLHREYIETDKPNTFIKFSISFNKDTIHWATSQPKKKGYCITVVPVERELKGKYTVETSGAFTGFYEIIYPIDRQSKKRLAHAISLLHKNKERYLDFFRAKGVNIKEDKVEENSF